MTLYIKGTDVKIAGTLEVMRATSEVSGLSDDGTMNWTGRKIIHDDHSETVFRGAYPVWIGAGSEYEEFHGVDVEDRRGDGTVVAYKGLIDDATEDELVDLLNLVIAKAGEVVAKESLNGCIRLEASGIMAQVNDLETKLKRLIRSVRGQDA